MTEWFLEYEIVKDRPGLLGDLATLLGMLSINIKMINGIDDRRRCMLLTTDNHDQIERFREISKRIDHMTVTKLKEPSLREKLAIRHGHYISKSEEEQMMFRFVRAEVGLLVDFMAELFKKEGHLLIGMRGMPRVGKTESIIAASVCANKRWTFVSSTLLRKTMRSKMSANECSSEFIYIIDGIVSTMRSTKKHRELVDELMKLSVVKVIEHPDIFVREMNYSLDDFDIIIELRNDKSEEITLDIIESGFSSFDIS